MTMIDLAQFDGHTSAPWAPAPHPMKRTGATFDILGRSADAEDADEVCVLAHVYTGYNAALIAAAPALLAECRRLRADNARLREALDVLVDHAEETYPHFESERGQRDIAQARAALAAHVEG
jgi:hypothetical protein